MPETETVTISSDSERYAKKSRMEDEYVRMKKEAVKKKCRRAILAWFTLMI